MAARQVVPQATPIGRLLEECRNFQARVQRGEARLGEKIVDILPPDPIGELGSGWGKVRDGEKAGLSLPVVG